MVEAGVNVGARLPGFRRCPLCTWDPLTDEGTKACRWVDCPYLPSRFDVHCPDCFFNFFTWEGNPPCDPGTCPRGQEPAAAAERARLLEVGG